MTGRVCPAPDCERALKPGATACVRHWRALPRSLRRKIDEQAGHDHNLAVQMDKAQRVWSGKPPGGDPSPFTFGPFPK